MTSNDQVLIVIPTDELGGAEQLLKTIARKWINEKQEVLIICLTRQGRGNGWSDLEDNMRYIPTDSVYRGLMKLPAYLQQMKFSLTISSQVYVNGTLGILRGFGILKTRKLVLRESTSVFLRFTGFKKSAYQFVYRLGYKSADLVIYQTELMKNQLEENFAPARNWNNAVLANPLDLDMILSQSEYEMEIDLPSRFILGVGRLIPQKGFDLLINAFKKLSESHPDIALVIIGEGEQRTLLESMIDDLDLRQKVFLPGFISNPFPFMKKATLCVMSSRIEGFPNTLLQMMALNTRVVSTISAGGVDKIPFIESVPVNDTQALILAMKKVLANQETSLSDMRNYLRKRSVGSYLKDIQNHL